MRTLEVLLLTIGVICLALYGFFTVQAAFHQAELERALELQLYTPDVPRLGTPPTAPAEGDLVGRLEIPRLNLSVMVMEGVSAKTLDLGAGHIPGTSYPGTSGNAGIAAHRDTFFREIRDIKKHDTIRFTVPGGTLAYRVISTAVVDPRDVHVLKSTSEETITLVTCYPFYYIGPAPKRFVVRATRESTPVQPWKTKSFDSN